MSGSEMAGGARRLGGEVREGLGAAAGDAKAQIQGRLDQAAGSVQENFAAVCDATGRVGDFARDSPWTALALAFGLGYLVRSVLR